MSRGDQAVAIVLKPRGTGAVAGTMYLDGAEFGPIDGEVHGDSLTWRVLGFGFTALRSADRISADLHVAHGAVHHFDVSRSPHDTTWALPAPAVAPSAAAAIPRDHAPDSVYRAHAVPAGPVSSIDPALRKGTLLLVGGGAGQPDLDRRFVELAGGAGARIVLIPTATLETSDPAELQRFVANITRMLGVDHVTVLHTTSRREADTEAFVKPLRDATGVMITGGEGEYLLDSYMGTRTERELVDLLGRGGVISGTSAGALIWGSTLETFRAHPGESQARQMQVENLLIGNPHAVGFGVLRNVAIQPHYTEFGLDRPFRKLVGATPGLLGLGIDESTALEVHGDAARVLGRGNVRIVIGPADAEPLVLKEGDRIDLVRRTRL
jgi:cyanophycinase